MMKKGPDCYGMTVLLVLISAVLIADASHQDDTLADLQNRMEAVEDRVVSLSDEVASLNSRLTELEGGEEKEKVDQEFRLVNLSETYDRESGTFNFIVEYEAIQKPLILMAPNAWIPPVEMEHDKGLVQFSVPDTEVSPFLYVQTPSQLKYTLILVHMSGPPRPTRPMVHVTMTTTPPHFLPLPGDGPAQLTVTTRVVGNRTVREEGLTIYRYRMEPEATDVSSRSFDDDALKALTSDEGSAKVDDVGSETNTETDDVTPDSNTRSDGVTPDGNAGNDDMDRPSDVRLVRGTREGKQTNYTLSMTAGSEEVGVMFVEQRFEFRCSGCVLYELQVSRPVVFYPAGRGYYVPEGALLPYRDSSHQSSTVSGPQYLAFTRYESFQDQNTTCREGESCLLLCEIFGDNPNVHFVLFASPVGRKPVYYDQSGTRLQDNQQGKAAVSGWSVQMGFTAFSVLMFQSVRVQDADTYTCVASLSSGRTLTHHTVLTVLSNS